MTNGIYRFIDDDEVNDWLSRGLSPAQVLELDGNIATMVECAWEGLAKTVNQLWTVNGGQNYSIPRWSDLSECQQRLFARGMWWQDMQLSLIPITMHRCKNGAHE